ncbi:MAG: rhodanese-like domain-containing protein [Candidatus Marinimicrobia bacterium]|nr:rhodanese-like domain-containing protein [Candidatus Neomarinimicrobiota bacterium]
MNKILAIILASTGILMYGCNDNKSSAVLGDNAAPIMVSGRLEGGYRQITMRLSGEPVELTVYRGDYIKFHLDDQGDPQVDYQLDVPELGISSIIKDTNTEQPFFKMKKSGKYEFSVGEQHGTIEVVELRQSNYTELSAEEAWEMMMKNPPFLLDVRTSAEYSRGYLKDAVLMPLQDLQARAGELERYKNQPILIYCATGNRSTTASKILLDQGFMNVMNLRMGIMGWASKGYNIEFQ